jgi:RimJ/RimL family protein N-acetyltransferase
MLNHAFNSVDTTYFVVGQNNLRSRKAMGKIGGTKVPNVGSTPVTGELSTSVVFQIQKSNWRKEQSDIAFIQPSLETTRLILEPIDEEHAQAMWELFGDPKLHDFVPYEPLTLEKQRERCGRWANRRSPDGSELWLNWAGRDRASGKVVAHFQFGVKSDGLASVGYLVSREFQGKGIATEGLQSVFSYISEKLGVREVKAWTDTRNKASHQLAKKLGMSQVEFLKDADVYTGATSDEYVFSKVFR